MDKVSKKYLERMLEGCEMGLSQIDEAIASVSAQLGQVQTQFDEMSQQKEEMLEAQADLTKLLGVEKGPRKISDEKS